MEINAIRRRGPLSKEEKQQCRSNLLCFYCGGPWHIAINCPHWPIHQVNRVFVIDKPESISFGVSNNLCSPSSLDKFELLR